MIAELKFWRLRKHQLEAESDVYSEEYMFAKSTIERLEREIGDWTETIDYSKGDIECLVLPTEVWKAALANDIQKVLNWLGPPPIDKRRINGRNTDFLNYALVSHAVMGKRYDLLSILLQLGADADPISAHGHSPLEMIAADPEYNAQARLLLEWGAEISDGDMISRDNIIQNAVEKGNTKLANLLKSEFGGRRCEIINLSKYPDLIGKTCVVEKYLPDKDRYKVIFETTPRQNSR